MLALAGVVHLRFREIVPSRRQKQTRRDKMDRDTIMQALARISLPTGGDLVSNDMIRALSVEDGVVKYVIEAPSAEIAQKMEAIRKASEELVMGLPGIRSVSAILTAHGPVAKPAAGPAANPSGPPPDLKIGRHPEKRPGPAPVPGGGSHHRHRLGQGRSGQIHRFGQSGRGAGASGQKGGPSRCRYIRPLAAAHDGGEQAPLVT